MGKNISRSNATKVETVGRSKRNEATLLRGNVRILLQKLDRAAASSVSALKATAEVMEPVAYYVGIDLGHKKSNYCVMNTGKDVLAEDKMPTTHEAFTAYFSAIPRSRIALEVGTHSPWVNALLKDLGHEVYVANPRKMDSIKKNKRKNDKVDAQKLARLVRSDPELLYPIQHREVKARQHLILLRGRDAVVATRTKLINCVRGLVKSVGGRVPRCSAECFCEHAEKALPECIRETLFPIVKQIAMLTALIKRYDRQVNKIAAEHYPETELLQQPKGVGALTALAFVLTVEKPQRFRKSRDLGPYLGLVPKQDDSGEISKQLHITKTGDQMVRRLLVTSSQYILGPFGQDSDLRRFGLKLAARGGKNAKKRAVAAVARKLAVLLHRLWVTGEVYEPLRNTNLQQKLAEAVNS